MLRKKFNSNEQTVDKVNYAPEKHFKEGSSRESKRNQERGTISPRVYVEKMRKNELDRGDTGKLPDKIKESPKTQLEKIKVAVQKNEHDNQKDVKNPSSQMKTKKTGQCSINIINIATNKSIEKTFKDEQQYKIMNIEERKKLRDKYTFKLKSVNASNEPANLNSREEIKRNGPNENPEFSERNADRFKRQSTQEALIQKEKASSVDSQLAEGKNKIETETESFRSTFKPKNDKSQLRESVKKEDFERKPIIKTITSRHDTKVYKAVTFIDQKKKPAHLQINVPNNPPMKKLKLSMSSQSRSKIPRLVLSKSRVQAVPTRLSIKAKSSGSKLRLTISKISVKNKKRKNKKRRYTDSSPELYKSKNGVLSSPDLSIAELHPPTEVAKWAPSSINRHTQPYYEAWVNTTLAAVLKEPAKEISDRKLIRSFKKALLERPRSPELEYVDKNDERYTGRIKVRQR